MSDNSKFKSSPITILFLVWATYLIVKGINVNAASKNSDAAEAMYVVGGAVIAALALLSRQRSQS